MLCINTKKKKRKKPTKCFNLEKNWCRRAHIHDFITQSNATTIITFMRRIYILQFSNIKIGAYYVGSSEEGGLHFDDKSHVFCMKQII